MSEPTPNERLVRIETKLDSFIAGHSDHETRIRALERAKWTAAGFAAAGGGAVGTLLTQLMGG